MGALRAEIEEQQQTGTQTLYGFFGLLNQEEYEEITDSAIQASGYHRVSESIDILKKYATSIHTLKSLEDLAKVKKPNPKEYLFPPYHLFEYLEFLNDILEIKIDITIQHYSEDIDADLNKKRYAPAAEKAEELKRIAIRAPELEIEMEDIENIRLVSQYGMKVKKTNTYNDLRNLKRKITKTITIIKEDSPSIPYFLDLKEYLDQKIRRAAKKESTRILQAIERLLNKGLSYAAKKEYDRLGTLGVHKKDVLQRIEAEDRKDPKVKLQKYKENLRLLKNTDSIYANRIQMIHDLKSEIEQYKARRNLEKLSKKRLDSLLNDLIQLEKRSIQKPKKAVTRKGKFEQEKEAASKTVHQLLCSYSKKIEDVLTFYTGRVDFYRILSLVEKMEDSRIICLCSCLNQEQDRISWDRLKSFHSDRLILRETNMPIPIQTVDEILVLEGKVLTPAVRAAYRPNLNRIFSRYDAKRVVNIVDILSFLKEFGYTISDYPLDLPVCFNRSIVPLQDRIIVDIGIILDNLELLDTSIKKLLIPGVWASKERFIQIYPNHKSISKFVNEGKTNADTKRFIRALHDEFVKMSREREITYVGRYKDLSKLLVDKYLTDFFTPISDSQLIVSKINYNRDSSMADSDLIDFLNNEYGVESSEDYILYDTFSNQLQGSKIEIPCFNLNMNSDNMVPQKSGIPVPYTKHMLVEDTEKETTLYLPSLGFGIESNHAIEKSMDKLITDLIKRGYKELNPHKEITIKQIDWYSIDALILSRSDI
ncbi:MAG: hypothetical protein SWO11_17625 [Thermodesulfobacteriota bacterium]|nr:hypothetical protein [Thermodesulfobacteriota bacterium]